MGWRETKLAGSSSATNYQAEGKDRQADHRDIPFNAEDHQRAIDNLLAKMRQHDPGGSCWQWVLKNLHGKWRQLMTALHEIDAAFERQRDDQFQQEIRRAGQLYRECVSGWRRAAKTRK
ncbi:hypothetical protein [Geotalea sp. SG265]|uniref:hypothetical protein n=1 Tax=Geotalea sp. SG265 TaxID=2922867 RepID=UPI001FAF0676|nr:hypothetical protein [Geotalea sp. SG265]